MKLQECLIYFVKYNLIHLQIKSVNDKQQIANKKQWTI